MAYRRVRATPHRPARQPPLPRPAAAAMGPLRRRRPVAAWPSRPFLREPDVELPAAVQPRWSSFGTTRDLKSWPPWLPRTRPCSVRFCKPSVKHIPSLCRPSARTRRSSLACCRIPSGKATRTRAWRRACRSSSQRRSGPPSRGWPAWVSLPKPRWRHIWRAGRTRSSLPTTFSRPRRWMAEAHSADACEMVARSHAACA
mmetsp:Transcript_58211/g.147790  ORF Transcript_58211/g.147790 Transcript_58211/m.147790 type:complete len:200 (+) Transcript_58211:504-1103(+)